MQLKLEIATRGQQGPAVLGFSSLRALQHSLTALSQGD